MNDKQGQATGHEERWRIHLRDELIRRYGGGAWGLFYRQLTPSPWPAHISRRSPSKENRK